MGKGDVAVVFLVRAADNGWRASVERFVRSYLKHDAGLAHRLYVLFKGFEGETDWRDVRSCLTTEYEPIVVPDEGFDIGSYGCAASIVSEPIVCFLNTYSELLCDDWLKKLVRNLELPRVGLVGATGSFESLRRKFPEFPPFPNIHVRSNGFMIERRLFCDLASGWRFSDKREAYLFESGPNSMSRVLHKRGLKIVVVGRDGRGYGPRWWTRSATYRLGNQHNLIVGDNLTRAFDGHPWRTKMAVCQSTWGEFLQPESLLHWRGEWG